MALSILVVDDDQNIRRIVSFHLQQEGFQVTQARNGSEAVEQVRAGRYDVVLMDVMMPVMDGFYACKTIKKMPETRDCAVIIFTAKGRKEDVVEALKSGADDYCMKPFDKKILLEKLKKIEMAKTIKVPSADRRFPRYSTKSATITWRDITRGGLEITYKERVIDISEKGIAFEHKRCDVCTGYEKGTVHPLCPLSKFAHRFPESEILEFMLTLPNDQVVVFKGKVAHVFQPLDWPKTEKVGISFVDLTREQQKIIKTLTS